MFAPGRGIEPLFAESKSAVLPIERPRTVPRIVPAVPGRVPGHEPGRVVVDVDRPPLGVGSGKSSG